MTIRLTLDPTTGKATLNGLAVGDVSGAVSQVDISAINDAIAVINQRLEEIEMTLQNQVNQAGLLKWIFVTELTVDLAVGNAYLIQSPDICVLTLPETAILGSEIRIFGRGSKLWVINQRVNQQISFGNKVTRTGVDGRIEATHTRDSISLRAVGDNQWLVENAIGNVFVVEP